MNGQHDHLLTQRRPNNSRAIPIRKGAPAHDDDHKHIVPVELTPGGDVICFIVSHCGAAGIISMLGIK